MGGIPSFDTNEDSMKVIKKTAVKPAPPVRQEIAITVSPDRHTETLQIDSDTEDLLEQLERKEKSNVSVALKDNEEIDDELTLSSDNHDDDQSFKENLQEDQRKTTMNSSLSEKRRAIVMMSSDEE